MQVRIQFETTGTEFEKDTPEAVVTTLESLTEKLKNAAKLGLEVSKTNITNEGGAVIGEYRLMISRKAGE